MRRSKDQVARTRQEILDAATTLMRERGLDGVSVADIMEKAGLTHGGFYKHFASKEALIAEALDTIFTKSVQAWCQTLENAKDNDGVTGLIERYLRDAHLKDLGGGCAIPALGSEVARAHGDIKGSFAKGINELIATLAQQIAGGSSEHKRERAIATVATMVGAMIMARCTEDEQTARLYLDATRKQLLRELLVAPR